MPVNITLPGRDQNLYSQPELTRKYSEKRVPIGPVQSSPVQSGENWGFGLPPQVTQIWNVVNYPASIFHFGIVLDERNKKLTKKMMYISFGFAFVSKLFHYLYILECY